jgi:hypothetical protein
MRALLAAPAVAVALLGSPPVTTPARADATAAPPYIDHTEWARWGGLPSLRVFPTPSGRAAARQPFVAANADEAWGEVLALSPGAETAGMRAQFVCHWQFAELAQPGKPSWNLEPWRPVVDDTEMVATGCNPGGPEEAF